MLLTDLMLIVALVVFLIVWWNRGIGWRRPLLWISALVALLSGIYGVVDYRWQDGFGVAVAGILLLVLAINALRRAKPRQGVPWLSGPLVLILVVLAVAPIYFFPVDDLPAPSGSYTVGVQDFELADSSRPGVLAAGKNEPRRLLVRTWYPAGDTSGLQRRPYFTDAEAATTATGFGRMMKMPFLFQYIKHSLTNSYVNAPVLPSARSLPVVIYSHGYTSFAGQNTALMEHLASHGYLVFSVQHTYDSSPVVFPNGDVVEMDPELFSEIGRQQQISEATKKAFAGKSLDERYQGAREKMEEAINNGDRIVTKSADIWLQDRIFLLDQLQQGAVPESVKAVVAAGDYAQTGQIGMSFGGSTSGGFCMVDTRCAAAVNLDGGDFHGTPFGKNIPVPFMMMYSDFKGITQYAGGDENTPLRGFNDFSYERPETAGLRDDVIRLMTRDVKHIGYSDFALYMRNPVREKLVGSIDANAMINIQNDFVLGFFDRYLLGKESQFPSMQFEKHQQRVTPNDISDVRKWWLDNHPKDITEQVLLETETGDVKLALYPERSPFSANNFLAYIDSGYFDGATMYRVTRSNKGSRIDVVQGGLLGDRISLPLEEIKKSESPLPPISHETTDQTGILNEFGTVAMARLAPGTASSEFFFNLADNPILDTGADVQGVDGFGYATFGRVLEGMRILRKIQYMPADAPAGLESMRGQILAEQIQIRKACRIVENILAQSEGCRSQ